jgi:hypothetical protein
MRYACRLSDGDLPLLVVTHRILPLLMIALIILLLVSLVSRAIRLSCAEDSIETPPICEGCGYNLTHLSESGLCSECGMSVEASLTPGLLRRSSRWEEKGTSWSWLTSTVCVLFSPKRFYQGLRLRTPLLRVGQFVVLHRLVIAVAAATWIAIIYGLFDDRAVESAELMSILPISLIIGLLGWALHRFIAFLMLIWSLVQRELRDYGWARRVVSYEAAYLWVFCAYNSLWITAVVYLLPDRVLGFEIVPILLFGGNLILIVVWAWRFRLAYRAIRWNNF